MNLSPVDRKGGNGGNGGNGGMDTRPLDRMFSQIKVRGEAVGTLSVQEGAGTFLSSDDQAVLDAVADRVALAIENARLVEQTRTALVKVEQLYQASRTLGTAENLEGIFQLTAEQLSGCEFPDLMGLIPGPP